MKIPAKQKYLQAVNVYMSCYRTCKSRTAKGCCSHLGEIYSLALLSTPKNYSKTLLCCHMVYLFAI
jgi:hypothetical protein